VLRIRVGSGWSRPAVLALPVGGVEVAVLPPAGPMPPPVTDLAAAFLAEADHSGAAGAVQALPRPGDTPRRLLLVGVGDGD
jgi:hypothetical protein